MKNLLTAVITWLFIFPFRWLMMKLPLKIAFRMGRAGGFVYYLISPVFRKKLRKELKKLFPEKNRRAIERIILRTCMGYIQTDLEDFLYPRISENNIDKLVEVKGLHHIESALAKGRGVILLHAHFGNPKMLMPALGYRGYKLNQIGLPPTDSFHFLEDAMSKKPAGTIYTLMKIKEESESTLPVNFIYLNKTMNPVISRLKKNEIMALSIDAGRGKMITINFMGRKGAFMTGPIRIGLRTGAVILPIFITRKRDHTHVLNIKPPLIIEDKDNANDAIESAVKKFVWILEEYMREYPCHYARVLGYNAPPFNVE